MIRKTLLTSAIASCLLLSGCNNSYIKDSQFGNNGSANQETAKYYTTVGMIHIQRGDLDKAKRPLIKALESSPNYADAHAAFALMYIMEGEYKLADQHYDEAIDSEPNNARILNNYGSFLYSQEEYKKAVKVLKQATSDTLYEKRAAAFVNLAQAEIKLNKKDDAVEHLEKAIQLDPKTYDAYLNLAKISYESGDLIKADDLIDKYRASRGRHSPQSLLIGAKVSNELGNKGKMKSYEMVLRNLYSGSKEYQALFDYQVKQKLRK